MRSSEGMPQSRTCTRRRFDRGELQGVLPKARVFEFRLGDSSVIRGKISRSVRDPDLLNRELHRRTAIHVMVTRVGNGPPRYLLLDAPPSG